MLTETRKRDLTWELKRNSGRIDALLTANERRRFLSKGQEILLKMNQESHARIIQKIQQYFEEDNNG